MKPWNAPIRRPSATPTASAMIQIQGLPSWKPMTRMQELGLRHAHDHADHAFDGADRKVDVAHDDDQHHAGRHDRDRRGLHRQVPQIARRQEKPAGQDMEADPDDQQRADHAEHARVEFGCLEEASDDAELGSPRPIRGRIGDRRVGSRIGHDVLPPVCRLARLPEHDAIGFPGSIEAESPLRNAAAFGAAASNSLPVSAGFSCRPRRCRLRRRRRPRPS